MPHTNAIVLRDKEGIPIPQYFDVLEGVFKPLTTEGYPGQKVLVENHPQQVDEVSVKNFPAAPTEITVNNLPIIQDVKITNPADPVEFPHVQKVTVENQQELVTEVGVKNFPANQQVTVTNQKDIQKVKDDLVLAKLTELETQIKATNTKLNGVVDTRLTGSKQGLSTSPKPTGIEGETYLEYNVTTQETKVYKYISGDWREL